MTMTLLKTNQRCQDKLRLHGTVDPLVVLVAAVITTLRVSTTAERCRGIAINGSYLCLLIIHQSSS